MTYTADTIDNYVGLSYNKKKKNNCTKNMKIYWYYNEMKFPLKEMQIQ